MRTLILPSLVLLSACTVGPNYQGPESAGAVAPPAKFVRAQPETVAAQPVVASWWTGLRDPMLDHLEARALAGNPNIAVAEARLRQARAGLRLERANQLPNANAQAMGVFARLPGIDLGGAEAGTQGGGGDSESLQFYNLGFDASWEVDLFGLRRRGVEAARASLGRAEAGVADVQVSLTAEVAQAYVALRDRQQRLALGQATAERQRRMLALTQERYGAGTTSALEVERLRTQLEQTDATLVPLTAERDAYLNALAILVGEAPGALDTMLVTPGRVPLPPAQVAVGDPAALLQRRPDIRAAERQLAQSNARIGVAEAQRFPQISLMGMLGLGGTDPGDVFDTGNLFTLGMPRLSWNFLDFGRNAARVEQAKGVRDEAAAQYRASVLTALRDAEDALSRYGARRRTVASAARTRASADRAAALQQQRYAAGTATLIDTLDAERQRLSAEQSLAQATAAMTSDFIALQKALGLGWGPAPAP